MSGRRAAIVILNALLALPSVVVGLVVYLLLSRAGPLGSLGILFTPTAIVIAQAVLVMPIVAALGVTIAALVVFGVGPALIVARADVAPMLRFDARSGQESSRRRRMRYALVAAQTALALVMLSGSMLLARSLARLQAVNLGYQPDHLSLLAMTWPFATYGTGAKFLDVAVVLASPMRDLFVEGFAREELLEVTEYVRLGRFEFCDRYAEDRRECSQ